MSPAAATATTLLKSKLVINEIIETPRKSKIRIFSSKYSKRIVRFNQRINLKEENFVKN